MSLSDTFSAVGIPQAYDKSAEKPKRKRPAPFSIRLGDADRARLAMEAAGAPLGAYIKAKVLSGQPIRSRRTGLVVQDRAALAKGLALLGRSRLANNLNQLAYAANIGSLPITPETEEALRDALRDIRELRRLFMFALGLKEETAP